MIFDAQKGRFVDGLPSTHMTGSPTKAAEPVKPSPKQKELATRRKSLAARAKEVMGRKKGK